MVLGFEIALFSICAVSTFNLCQVLYYLIALSTYVCLYVSLSAALSPYMIFRPSVHLSVTVSQ